LQSTLRAKVVAYVTGTYCDVAIDTAICRKPLANIIVDEDEGKAHAVSEASGVKEGANHDR
jgi:hypothetical protein